MDKPIFRMSESGKCLRALSAKLLGCEPTPAPSWLETAANEGKWHEKRIVEKLREHDNVFDQQQEVSLEYPTFVLVGHIDGKIQDYDLQRAERLLEIKSMSQFEFQRWMRGGFASFPNYASQITCYMEATELKECLYIVKNRSSGYEDRQVLTSTPDSMVVIEYKFQQVVEAVQLSKLCQVDLDLDSIECQRCDYKYLCVPEVKELTPLEKADLDFAAKEWRRGKAITEKGQAMIDNAREIFDQHTRATNIFKWQHSGLAIQLVHYNEQKTYPKSKLLQHFTEEQLEPAGQIKEAYDQLRISDMEEN